MKPLVLTEEEFIARQAEFADYPRALSQNAVETTDPVAFTIRIRKIILNELTLIARDNSDSGIPPQSPVWGPTVKSTSACTIYYNLVPQGTEDQYSSTDGMASEVKPPPLPIPASGNGATPLHPSLKAAEVPGLTANLEAARNWPPPAPPSKLYKVIAPLEVTEDFVREEMALRKTKRSKPSIYIRGTIVEPKVRIEI